MSVDLSTAAKCREFLTKHSIAAASDFDAFGGVILTALEAKDQQLARLYKKIEDLTEVVKVLGKMVMGEEEEKLGATAQATPVETAEAAKPDPRHPSFPTNLNTQGKGGQRVTVHGPTPPVAPVGNGATDTAKQ